MVVAGIQRLKASKCVVFPGLELLFARWCLGWQELELPLGYAVSNYL